MEPHASSEILIRSDLSTWSNPKPGGSGPKKIRSDYMAGSRSAFLKKLYDRQFKIHTHMRTGDLLALRFSCHQLIAARQTGRLNT